ncbi:MAG TPA: hypothetical protein VHA12_00265 [Candidatus Nanoarchaeia archaeon]|nr:hypothetical protein [Candidatus Nanoarchaeia archaeon]
MDSSKVLLKLTKIVVQYKEHLQTRISSVSPDEPLGVGWKIITAIYSGKEGETNYGLALTPEQFSSRGMPSELEHSFQ